MKPYYIFDNITGEYLETYIAQESPLEKGVYIAPQHSTDITYLPVGAKEAAVFSARAWTTVPDFRGETWYDQTSGSPEEITALGQPAANLAATLPAAILLSNALTDQVNIVTKSCSDAILAGFQSSALDAAHTYPTQPIDQSNLIGCVTASHQPGLPSTWTCNFWCADGSGNWALTPHTAAQIQQVLADGVTQREAYCSKLVSLVQQIETPNLTIAQIQAVVW